jgi:hypothetical protein
MFHPSTLLHVSFTEDHHLVDTRIQKYYLLPIWIHINVHCRESSTLFMDDCLVMWLCVSVVSVYDVYL